MEICSLHIFSIFSQVARYVAHVLTRVEPQCCFDSYVLLVLLLNIIMKVPRSWQLSKVFSLWVWEVLRWRYPELRFNNPAVDVWGCDLDVDVDMLGMLILIKFNLGSLLVETDMNCWPVSASISYIKLRHGSSVKLKAGKQHETTLQSCLLFA